MSTCPHLKACLAAEGSHSQKRMSHDDGPLYLSFPNPFIPHTWVGCLASSNAEIEASGYREEKDSKRRQTCKQAHGGKQCRETFHPSRSCKGKLSEDIFHLSLSRWRVGPFSAEGWKGYLHPLKHGSHPPTGGRALGPHATLLGVSFLFNRSSGRVSEWLRAWPGGFCLLS